ncbi:TPA: type II toxin-antitoxin system death-on-curing family toxin [Enterobacter hormaechei subsp. xiangfangensis]|nr:type II toxin-antitoxin system death-on-curing family toxin [Enterobacter hormaechei subsp. xiangfangensis]HAV1890654.1 type II toxin-antitoxin system death-on-curing family toxin [Enterobacter hormaechei subsp. xiangfangensis]
MNLTFLRPELVIQLHDSILTRNPGLAGLKEPGLVDALCQRVINLHFYEQENDPFTLAAMYMMAIARGHVFNDANKRTALMSALYFLAVNNIHLSNDPALTDLTVEVAQGKKDLETIAETLNSFWLRT